MGNFKLKRADKKIFVYAALVTLALFILIYAINVYLSKEREQFLEVKMDEFIEDYEEMQTLSMMSDVFGEEMACLSMKARKQNLDTTLWDIGIKIDRYRALTEEFMSSPFYIDQKKKFNRNEIVYLSMIKEMEEKCSIDELILLFFYKKKEECPDCDAQSFVLTDLNRQADDEVSVFSFDTDLELQSIAVLTNYYNITEFPCIVIEEDPYCGLKDKKEILDVLCSIKNLSICN